METAAPNKPKRRLRISLRVLMLLVLAAGAWMGQQVRRAREQREAVAAVKKYGGWVHYDWEFVDGQLAPGAEPPAPRWLRRLVGDEFFQWITHVDLTHDSAGGRSGLNDNEEPADEVLAVLSGQAGLKTLRLADRQVTDRGLAHVRGLDNLEDLSLIFAHDLTDEGLSPIGGLKNLKHLDLSDSTVTDAGLAHLGRLSTLEQLDLGSCPVTDIGMTHLAGLKNLRDLNLRSTGVGEQGFERLHGLTRLRTLQVQGSGSTARSVERLEAAIAGLDITP